MNSLGAPFLRLSLVLSLSSVVTAAVSGCNGNGDKECLEPEPYQEYCIHPQKDECDIIESVCRDGKRSCDSSRVFAPAPPEFDDWAWRCGIYLCDAQQIPEGPLEDWQNEEPYIPPNPDDLTGEWRLVANSQAIVPVGCERQPIHYAEVGSIAVDPTNPDVLYVGMILEETRGDTWASGVFKSVDGGETWFEARATLGSEGENDCFGPCSYGPDAYRLFIDPDDPQVLYASTTERGLWRTRNGARTWEFVELPYTFKMPGPVGKCSSGVYYAVGGGSVFTSDDGGDTWNDRQSLGGAGRFVTALAFDPGVPDRVWAGMSEGAYVQPGEGFLFLSDDNGDSWIEMGQDIDEYCQGHGSVWSISICGFDQLQMAASVYLCGLFLSDDGGLTWSRATSPVDSIQNRTSSFVPLPDRCRLYTSDGVTNKLFWTEDHGTTWNEEFDVPIDFFFFNPYAPENMMGILRWSVNDHAPFELWIRE